jgi:hypothetical protein
MKDNEKCKMSQGTSHRLINIQSTTLKALQTVIPKDKKTTRKGRRGKICIIHDIKITMHFHILVYKFA